MPEGYQSQERLAGVSCKPLLDGASVSYHELEVMTTSRRCPHAGSELGRTKALETLVLEEANGTLVLE